MINEILEHIQSQDYKRKEVSDFVAFFDMHSPEDFKEIVKTLVTLEETGFIVRDKFDRYDLAERLDFYRGTILVNERGFGFVQIEDKVLDDVYVSKQNILGAHNRDKVLVKITRTPSDGKSIEGKIERVLERGLQYLVGSYHTDKEFDKVVAHDKNSNLEIIIHKNNSMGAMDHHIVKVQIISYIDENKVEAKVDKIIGHENDPGIDILSVVNKHDIPYEYPEEVIEQAMNIPESITDSELANRLDLRDELIITIDGADAKDLDDAVYVKKTKEGYELGVFIADVSYYVEKDSPIDKEAYRRGTSVYLVDRVIPMIPHRLSNGICSLNPKEDRLTIGCIMKFDEDGHRLEYTIVPAVIHSKERMTYQAVNQMIHGNQNTINEYNHLKDMVEHMVQLSSKLRKNRNDRGNIEFDLDEAKILVDESGSVSEVVLRERDVAERLIEDFMLAANETVAEHFHWLEFPFIYRIHDEPKTEKIAHLINLVKLLGHKIKGTRNQVHASVLRELLKSVKGEPEEKVINTLLLRSMSKAKYSNVNVGHFGLSASYYTHFTSPIRRYPDLIVHRLIRDMVFEHNVSDKNLSKWQSLLGEIGESTSRTERRAMICEREVLDMKKAEFMKQHIGEEFNGVISNVLSWGMYVELDNTIEGLVHMNDLTDDYYVFHEDTLSLIGKRSRKIFKIGDRIKIVVTRASVESREIDFGIVGIKQRGPKRKIAKRKPLTQIKGPNFIKKEEWTANKPKKKHRKKGRKRK